MNGKEKCNKNDARKNSKTLSYKTSICRYAFAC